MPKGEKRKEILKLNKIERIGEERYNNQGSLMKIVEYNRSDDIVIEFQDYHNEKVHTQYDNFKKGIVKNPYCADVMGVGILGNKYASKYNGKNAKEYNCWEQMLKRCFSESYKNKNTTYKDVVCGEEWLYYPNFYEWLHSQENFDKWFNGNRWGLDKDILIKGNKIYSPDTCCLVPLNVNNLFIRRELHRGKLPIGVIKYKNKFKAFCENPFTKTNQNLGIFETSDEAFQVYKQYKENIIKKVAQEEYLNGNITKECYDAMMRYKVEITD